MYGYAFTKVYIHNINFLLTHKKRQVTVTSLTFSPSPLFLDLTVYGSYKTWWALGLERPVTIYNLRLNELPKEIEKFAVLLNEEALEHYTRIRWARDAGKVMTRILAPEEESIGKTVKVTRAQVAAAQLRLRLDQARGLPSDPAMIKIANAKRPKEAQ